MSERYDCHACKKQVTATKSERYRSHSNGDGEPCANSSEPIPDHILAQPVTDDDDPSVPREGVDFSVCPQCDRKVKLTSLGYFEPHETTLRGGDRCPVGGVRARHARKLEDVPLPGDGKASSPVPKVSDSETTSTNADAGDTRTGPPLTNGSEIDWSDVPTGHPEPTWLDGSTIDWSKVGDLTHPGIPPHEVNLARDPMASAPTATSSPESSTTSKPSLPESGPQPTTSSDALEEPADALPFHLAPLLGDGSVHQPFSHIFQPGEWTKAQPMGDLAKELATKIKETFYAYSNRKTADNRSAQTTLGPSEIGTPCDRRLAMTLLGISPVNPGGDGWAAFVGTCTHAGMAEVYTFADAGTGRYAVELPVFTGVPVVPRGTTDLLDRRDGTVVDWKVMGAYSLKKFKEQGPSATYRTQAHVYGLGAEKGGERVKNVAVVGLPRAGRSLDEMHVWTEKYDKRFARAALDRVERIANEVSVHQASRQIQVSPPAVRERTPMEVAADFPVADDCSYCPFHLKGDREMKRGCPGK